MNGTDEIATGSRGGKRMKGTPDERGNPLRDPLVRQENETRVQQLSALSASDALALPRELVERKDVSSIEERQANVRDPNSIS